MNLLENKLNALQTLNNGHVDQIMMKDLLFINIYINIINVYVQMKFLYNENSYFEHNTSL